MQEGGDEIVAESSGDIITDFVAFTSNERSPEIYRKWAAISMVAGALERRVWVKTGGFITFPNLYVFLVGPPGVGKKVINIAKELLSTTNIVGTKERAFTLAPDSMTPAALADSIYDAKKQYLPPKGEVYEYCALYIAAEEFSILMPQHDMHFVGILNGVWNNPRLHVERRRHGKPPITDLPHPVLNFIGGVQPAFISSTFPEETWTTGLGRRSMMIYHGEEQPIRSPFDEQEGLSHLEPYLTDALAELSGWFGQIEWDKDARDMFEDWWMDGGGKPVPTHSKLLGYKNNRQQNIMKFVGISVASRRAKDRKVQKIDFERARAWLLEAEALMPDIFRAMIGRSDHQVLEELHIMMVAKWQVNRKSVSQELMHLFLVQMVPGNKAKEIVMQAEMSGFIRRDTSRPGDFWFPSGKINPVAE